MPWEAVRQQPEASPAPGRPMVMPASGAWLSAMPLVSFLRVRPPLMPGLLTRAFALTVFSVSHRGYVNKAVPRHILVRRFEDGLQRDRNLLHVLSPLVRILRGFEVNCRRCQPIGPLEWVVG
jgi:hypothetical protein